MGQHDKRAVKEAAKAAKNSYANWWAMAFIKQQRKKRRKNEGKRTD